MLWTEKALLAPFQSLKKSMLLTGGVQLWNAQ